MLRCCELNGDHGRRDLPRRVRPGSHLEAQIVIDRGMAKSGPFQEMEGEMIRIIECCRRWLPAILLLVLSLVAEESLARPCAVPGTWRYSIEVR